MKRISRFAKVAVPAALAGLILSVGTPANAAQEDCPNGYICLWEHPNFEGRMKAFVPVGGGVPSFVDLGFDNVATSGWNRSSVEWCTYEHPYYLGQTLSLFRVGGQSSQFSAATDDKASSAKPC